MTNIDRLCVLVMTLYLTQYCQGAGSTGSRARFPGLEHQLRPLSCAFVVGDELVPSSVPQFSHLYNGSAKKRARLLELLEGLTC